ncbi:MAG: hypothetical protein KDI90_07035 [Alphaproteobacteria bacterium]|nr:hypothetical protein [Alphaproteobacteria bacterium]MCB9974401.1 hypothetical protein [Rhodospirillales bacterium]
MIKNLFFLIPVLLIFFYSGGACARIYMQEDGSPPTIVTKEEDIKVLKTLMEARRKILLERQECTKTAKDFKQECFCDKESEYAHLAKMVDDILLQDEHLNWFDSRLSFEENGKTVKTSIAQHMELAAEIDGFCLRNEDGTLRANHEYDKPGLKVSDQDDAKMLLSLISEQGKLGINLHNCSHGGKYTSEQCSCSYKPQFQSLLDTVNSLLRKHPNWMDHVLTIPQTSHVTRVSLEEKIRVIKDFMKECKK